MREKMFEDYLEYLKDPHLVAKIQNFFGVEIHEECQVNEDNNAEGKSFTRNEKKGEKIYNGINNIKAESNGYFKEKTNDDNDDYVAEEFLAKEKENIDENKSTITTNSPPKFTIRNSFWYYLFLFGTELGDEIFYISFIPFWFWNVDGPVGRRVFLVWCIIMVIGQALKDIICWPRPACPPVARLQNKWSQEYGMPSTHAMVGMSIPFSVLIYTMNRYIYSFPVASFIATIWCAVVCMSRLYLGMHTVLDLIGGLALAIGLMIPLVPLIDITDHYFLTNGWILSILIILTIVTIIYYPSSDRWTPTRGDTTMVVSVTSGVHFGSWLNFTTGALSESLLSPPYEINWPTYQTLALIIFRTIFGFCCVIFLRGVCKSLSYSAMCAILRINSKDLIKSENSLKNKNKVIVDLFYKYVTYFMVGFNIAYLMPKIFSIIGIGRNTFYNEM